METMEAEAKEADAEMTVGLTRTSEKCPGCREAAVLLKSLPGRVAMNTSWGGFAARSELGLFGSKE